MAESPAYGWQETSLTRPKRRIQGGLYGGTGDPGSSYGVGGDWVGNRLVGQDCSVIVVQNSAASAEVLWDHNNSPVKKIVGFSHAVSDKIAIYQVLADTAKPGLTHGFR